MAPPVQLVAVGLWVLVALGPVLGAAALLRPAPPAAPVDDGAAPPAVTGVAELAVVAHLRTADDAVPPPLAPAHPALRPAPGPAVPSTATVQATNRAAAVPVDAAGVVAAIPAGPGRWGVVVGVLRAGHLEAWQVTVAGDAAGALVETVPARVAVPTPRRPPTPATSPLRSADPDGADADLVQAVQRFADALLTGQGDLARYTAAGGAITAPDRPSADAALTRIATGPVDDRRLAVLAEVRATRADGSIELSQYPLLLQRTAGRWEVQRLLPALPVRTTTADPQTDPRPGRTP